MLYCSKKISFYCNIKDKEVAHLTFPPHTFSIQVKSETCYITGQWGRVQHKITLTLTLNLLLFFIIKFEFLSWFLRLCHFYGFFTAYFYEEKLSIRLYVKFIMMKEAQLFIKSNVLVAMDVIRVKVKDVYNRNYWTWHKRNKTCLNSSPNGKYLKIVVGFISYVTI